MSISDQPRDAGHNLVDKRLVAFLVHREREHSKVRRIGPDTGPVQSCNATFKLSLIIPLSVWHCNERVKQKRADSIILLRPANSSRGEIECRSFRFASSRTCSAR